ncbi:MAG: hypothetical protein ACFCUT_03520 [Kiloniellaceae bacterium]
MLDEDEWAQVQPLLANAIEQIKRYREIHGASLSEARAKGYGREALERYFQITGFRETNADALWHHRLSDFGPPCRACGKPLRTPRAKLCAECGEAVAKS